MFDCIYILGQPVCYFTGKRTDTLLKSFSIEMGKSISIAAIQTRMIGRYAQNKGNFEFGSRIMNLGRSIFQYAQLQGFSMWENSFKL